MVKTAGVLPEMLRHRGPAVVFDSHDEANAGILSGKVKPGDVVVIRYEGPKGGPGMQEMLAPTSNIMGMGLGTSVALITDGRFSGGTRRRVHRPRLARRRPRAGRSAWFRTATSSTSTSRAGRCASRCRTRNWRGAGRSGGARSAS